MYAPRVRETTTTTGTGNVTLAGAVTGFQSFDTAFGISATINLFIYWLVDSSSQWEVGYGHLSAASTLVRDTVVASTNSNAAINIAAGTTQVFNSWEQGSIIDTYTATGLSTWTKRPDAQSVTILLVGGGGGGGSGRQGAAASTRTAGGGGAGGGLSMLTLPAALVGATETVTVGAGATGASGQASASTNGTPGTAGNKTTFGQWLAANGGSAGNAGTATTVAASTGGIGNVGTGGTGGGCATNGNATAGGQGTLLAPGGGAGGSGSRQATPTAPPPLEAAEAPAEAQPLREEPLAQAQPPDSLERAHPTRTNPLVGAGAGAAHHLAPVAV